jgi:L-ascorbate metabolism protein UlaG (beta-lactamase superfamily)
VAHIATKTKAKLHGSASTLNVGRGGDVPEDQLVLFEPGKDYTIGQFTVSVVQSKHSPPMKGINDDLGETIDKPLKQPASFRDYKEGGSFDILIKRDGHAMLVKPSANYVDGALDTVRADVLFLGTATLGKQTQKVQDAIYDQTVKKVQPQLVVAIHWDNFFLPLDEHLEMLGKFIDDIPAGFDYLINRLKADKILFGLMRGYQSVILFGKDGPVGKPK